LPENWPSNGLTTETFLKTALLRGAMQSANQYQDQMRAICRRKAQQALERLRKENPIAAIELQHYLAAMEVKVKAKSLENYANQLSTIARRSDKPFIELTNEDIRALFKSIESKSTGTKYATYQALRSYFCDLLKYDRQMGPDLTSKWEQLMDNVKRPVTTKRLLTHNDLVSPEDLDKLLGACKNPRDQALVMTLFETGARLSELLSMEVRDVNFNARPVEIKIRHSKTEDKNGRRPAYIFRADPLLKIWLGQHPFNDKTPDFYNSATPVWVSWQPRYKTTLPMTTNTAGLMLERIKRRAGIPEQRRIFAHLFRHSRASDLRENYGMDVKEIKEILGHSKIETTDGYLTLNRSTMIQKLQGVDDIALQERRAEALRRSTPIPCTCGVSNDVQTAFCYKCGRVTNPAVARELVRRREDETATLHQQMTALQARMDQQQDLLQTLADARINAAKRKYTASRPAPAK
jgi:integrase